MSATDKIKVLVLGDSGVGKSSLVHLICHSQPITSPQWTIGCTIDVKLHEYKEATPQQRTCFIELWDIGGSRSHIIARNVFYGSFQGIILVHDLTNSKSEANLSKWLGSVFCGKDSLCKDNATTLSSAIFPVAANDNFEFDMESFFEKNIPVLVVATKPDIVHKPVHRLRDSSVAEECGAEEIQVDCHQAKSLAPASTNAVKLSKFLDKVCDKKFNSYNSVSNYLFDRNNKRHSNVMQTHKYTHQD